MALRDLLAMFHIGVDDKELKEGAKHVDVFKKRLEEVEKQTGGLSGKLQKMAELLSVGLFAEGVRGFIEGQIDAGAQLKVTSERLGVTTDDLQKFRLAVSETGASADDADTALRFLNRNIGQADEGTKSAVESFQKLGVIFKQATGDARPALEVVEDLADKIAGLSSEGEQVAHTLKIFGRGGIGILPLLKKGSAGIKELYKDFEVLGGGLSEDFAESAHKAEVQTKRLQFAFSGLKSRFVAEVIPGLVDLMQNTSLVVKSIIDFSKKTYALRTAFLTLRLGSFIFLFKRLWDILGLGKMNLTTMLSTLLRFGAPLAVLTALYIIFDDIYTMLMGGNSLLGQMIDKVFGVGATKKFVVQLKDAWRDLVTWWNTANISGGDLKKTFQDLGKALVEAFVTSLPYILSMTKLVVHAIGGMLGLLSVGISTASSMKDYLMDKIGWDEMSARIQASVANFDAGKYGSKLQNDVDTFGNKSPFSNYGDFPATSGAGGSIRNDVKINITGVADPNIPNVTGRAVTNALGGREMRDAYHAVATG